MTDGGYMRRIIFLAAFPSLGQRGQGVGGADLT